MLQIAILNQNKTLYFFLECDVISQIMNVNEYLYNDDRIEYLQLNYNKKRYIFIQMFWD